MTEHLLQILLELKTILGTVRQICQTTTMFTISVFILDVDVHELKTGTLSRFLGALHLCNECRLARLIVTCRIRLVLVEHIH